MLSVWYKSVHILLTLVKHLMQFKLFVSLSTVYYVRD